MSTAAKLRSDGLREVPVKVFLQLYAAAFITTLRFIATLRFFGSDRAISWC